MRQQVSPKILRVFASELFLTLAFVFFVPRGIAAVPAKTEEKPAIPADLYFDFKPVPPEDNAIINWRRAAEVEVPLDTNLTEVLRYCWTPGARGPSDQNLDLLQSWVRRNKEALDLFQDSLLKPKAQWPEQDPQNKQPEMLAFTRLIRARLFQADSLAKDKEFSGAVDSLEKSLKLTQLGIEGDATLIHYLLCASARTLVERGMLRLAAARDIPISLQKRLLKDLPRLDSETNTYANILRVEFTRYAYHTTDVHRLAETWAKIPETSAALWFFPDDLRRPFKVLLDPLLVAAHPKPLDEIASINNEMRHYRIFRTNSMSAWSNRSDIVQEECAATIEKLKWDIKPLMETLKDEPLPLSKQAAERASDAYIRIKNPIGRIFAGSILIDLASDERVFRSRTEREATRAILGLLIFEREKGMLPAKLSDLVNEKILDSVPFDPFANAPLSYSRERRIVWSVGEDGVNDGGEGAEELRWLSGDAVWKIPTIN